MFITGICKDSLLLLQPLLMLVDSAHRQHDMCMRIAVTLIMQRPVSNHSFAYKVLLNICPHTGNLLIAIHFCRKCHLNFPGELCVRSFLDFLHFIPEDFPI